MEEAPRGAAGDPETLGIRIAIGLLTGGVGVALRLTLVPVLGGEARYVLQAATVVLATWVAGYAGGIGAGAIAIGSAFLLPWASGGVAATLERAASVGVLACVVALLIVQVGRWREAERQLRRREEDFRSQAEVLRRRAEELERLMEARRKAEEQLAAANRAKDEFLGTLSHELRTPMNAILGWSHMIATAKLPPEHLTTAAAAIVRNAEAQHRLIEDVLDISRMTQGKFRVQREPVDVAIVIGKAIDSLQSAAEAKSLVVRWAAPSDLPMIAADADRLQQVVWNLLSNAIKFTPAGGEAITVTAVQEGNSLEIAVADRGEGMSHDFESHAFERFSQADSSMTRAHGGLGLGLAIVRHLVELHGGTVTGESPGPGQGSTFRVRLPVSPTAPASLADREGQGRVEVSPYSAAG